MRAYVVVTGSLAAVLTAAHLWRVAVENHLARDPFFVSVTLITAGLSIWAFRLVRGQNRASP